MSEGTCKKTGEKQDSSQVVIALLRRGGRGPFHRGGGAGVPTIYASRGQKTNRGRGEGEKGGKKK